MHALRHIVVGWDGSEAAGHAVSFGVGLAAAGRGRLDVVHVWDEHAGPVTPDPRLDRRAADRTLIHQIEPHVPSEYRGRVEAWVEAGRASAVLENLAASADLLVIGRGHPGAMRLGGRAAHLVHACRTPVAVVPSSSWRGVARVVAGVDQSAASAHVGRWAHDQAEVLGVPLVLLHAWTDPYDEMRWWGERDAMTRDAMAEAAARVLDGVAAELARERPGSTVAVEQRVEEDGAVAALIDAAGDDAMLVVGSHGYGGLGRLVLGSVALSVVHYALSPVVILR
jgi:nucleotide-binding universal stress UspA family protein